MSYQLKVALAIDIEELEKKNFRRLGTNMSEQLYRISLASGTKRKLEHDNAQGGEKGWNGGKENDGQVGLHGVNDGCTQRSGTSGRPVNMCLTDVCFTYLGALAFDGYPPLAKCGDSGCLFGHVIPTVPVSVEEKVRLISLTKVIKKIPQCIAALPRVFDKPNFCV